MIGVAWFGVEIERKLKFGLISLLLARAIADKVGVAALASFKLVEYPVGLLSPIFEVSVASKWAGQAGIPLALG